MSKEQAEGRASGHGPGSHEDPAAPLDRDGGEVVEKFVVAELTEERERRVRLDAQGAGLITASTALSALAFGIGALVAKQENYALPRLSLWGMAATFVAFMLAAVCGVYVGGKVHDNKVAEIETRQGWREPDFWSQSKNAALHFVLGPVIDYLGALRRSNNRRGFWVKVGYICQTFALLGLSIAIGAILADFILPQAYGWHHFLDPPE